MNTMQHGSLKQTGTFIIATLMVLITAGGRAEEQPKIIHDWPAYYGPDATYADLTKVPILADLSQAELVWSSEHADLGYGKSSSSGGHGYGTKSHPSGSTQLIIADGLVIQGYFNPKNNVVADDLLLAIDTATGKTWWKQVYTDEGYNRSARKHVQYAATPVAYDGKVFFLGSGGRLHCVDLATGKRVWDRDLEDYPARFKTAVAAVEVKPDAAEGVSEFVASVGLLRAMRSPLAVIGGVLFIADSTCYGVDPATGKDLWKASLADMYGGGTMPSPVRFNGIEYALYASAGKVRLLDPKSGRTLWTESLRQARPDWGLPSELVTDGRLFISSPNADKKLVLSAFALSETGTKLLWQSQDQRQYGGSYTYRDGILYYDVAQGRIKTYQADKGKVLCDSAGGQFQLWGDRLVVAGDHVHESIWVQCSYISLTPGYQDLKVSGGLLYPRSLIPTSEGTYCGVVGYGELWRWPVFVDGYLFTRGVNKVNGCGTIFCWDLQALPEDQRVTAAKEAFAKGQKTEAVKDLIGILKIDARRVRADACRALAQMGSAAFPAGPDLVRLLPEWWQPDGKAAFATLIALVPIDYSCSDRVEDSLGNRGRTRRDSGRGRTVGSSDVDAKNDGDRTMGDQVQEVNAVLPTRKRGSGVLKDESQPDVPEAEPPDLGANEEQG